MHKYHYRPGKSAFAGLAMGGIGLVAGWMWFSDPDSSWLSLGIALLCLAGALKVVLDGLSDVPALAFDSEGIRVRRTWGQLADFEWSEVQSIDVEVLTIRQWGFIPIARHEALVLKCDGGLFGAQRLRISLQMIDLPVGGAPRLLATLRAAHVAAVGEAGVVMAGAGEHGWGARSIPSLAPRTEAQTEAEFDAEAALARYLARKGSEDHQPAAASHAPQPAAPARPVFGRKSQAG